MSEHEFTIGRWSDHPYTSYDKRHIEVEHRVRVVVYGSNFVDVIHERRQYDETTPAPGWKTVETVEIRDYGARKQQHREGVLHE
jgi:hypothetical protein